MTQHSSSDAQHRRPPWPFKKPAPATPAPGKPALPWANARSFGTRYGLLKRMYDHGEPVTYREVSEWLDRSLYTVAWRMRLLLEGGFVRRTQVPHAAPLVLWSLTDEGRRVVEAVDSGKIDKKGRMVTPHECPHCGGAL